ncbi:putative DeoR family transcriptional regulator [Streptomyces sp. Tu6071]|uniref:helix-turn-helix transcriptional regulator n=1 Tax=Streptomyces sp. Tu6071 TaxID=355249 RepID=UPI00020E5144|nr:WYL domain-containing protein [Streptomyces sp. Tu6071]EGJ72909.1 putative DeoR family transcriptional regulator [Streptomyces sp. Tu6071]
MRAARLLRMALLVQSSPGLTAAALARALEVSERTVIRDAQALREAGVPVRAERGRAGGYHLAPGHRTRLTSLHPTEAETLYLGGLPTALADLGLGQAAGTARLKLAATLLPSLRAAAESSVRRFHLDAPAWFSEPAAPPLLPALARAVWDDRTVRLRYARPAREDRPARTVARVYEPYGLVLKAGVWYVVGRVPGEGARTAAWRTYRVERVTTLEPCEPFVRLASFDLATHWRAEAERFARALLRTPVTLCLTPEGLRRLPTALGPASTDGLIPGPPAPDGRVTVTVPTESEDVAFEQLAPLGADAEILAPPTLRARCAAHARASAERYGTGAEASAP